MATGIAWFLERVTVTGLELVNSNNMCSPLRLQMNYDLAVEGLLACSAYVHDTHDYRYPLCLFVYSAVDTVTKVSPPLAITSLKVVLTDTDDNEGNENRVRFTKLAQKLVGSFADSLRNVFLEKFTVEAEMLSLFKSCDKLTSLTLHCGNPVNGKWMIHAIQSS